MDSALWVAKAGLEAQDAQMSVAANNIANAGTTAFKQSRVEFADLIYQNIREAGGQTDQDTQNPTGLQVGTGVRIINTPKNFLQGNTKQTGHELDVMIQGKGFLQVEQPDGTVAYTRNGSLTKGVNGRLETQSGYAISPAIIIPDNATSISIGKNGAVDVTVPGQQDPQNLGQITLAKFINETGLRSVGDNLYQATAASGIATTDFPDQQGLGTLLQGSLESSNVSVVSELVNMIQIQRAYEMNSNAISTCNKMLQYATSHLA